MIQRLIDAAFMKTEVYRAVKDNESLTREALMAVVWIAVINGVIGFFVNLIWSGFGSALFSLVWGVIWSIAGYFLYAYLSQWLGTQFFGGKATVGQLRRTLGYAYGPTIIGSIPCIGFLGSLWTLATGVLAIREAHEVDTTKAIIIAAICIVIIFAISFAVSSIVGLGTFGLSLISGGGSGVQTPLLPGSIRP